MCIYIQTLTSPSSSGSPSTCPVNTPRQMRMELNWPMEPLMCFGVISPKYIGSTQRAIPKGKKSKITNIHWILSDGFILNVKSLQKWPKHSKL